METHTCQNCKNDFTIEPDDFSFYEKMRVPVPKVCPDCRFKMRALFRNEMSLYNRKCFITGKNIVSVYNPKSPYKAVSVEYYLSDAWDPYTFAQDYNYTKTFFEQLDMLLKNVYKKGLNTVPSIGPLVNSDYVNFAGGCKDAYFCFNTVNVENALYTKGVYDSKNVCDIYYGRNLENCHECVNVHKSNGVMNAKNSSNCLDCMLIENCHNCSNCFGCVNLRNQSYCYFNEQLTKEAYQEKINDIRGSYKNFEKEKELFYAFQVGFPKRVNQNILTVNCIGDYLLNSKNSQHCFEAGDLEDSNYIYASSYVKNCHSITAGLWGQYSLEVVSLNKSSQIIGSFLPENCENVEYSYSLNNCKNCFGCDSLRNAEYCVLNKQYSKEEYELLRQHIVDELIQEGTYGLMMPPSIAPFAYNETIAQDNMPMTKEEAVTAGFRWEDDIQMTKGKETVGFEQIPDRIDDVLESMANEILKCIDCQRNYRITEQELQFYRKIVIPVPHKCFYCRHRDRIDQRGPYKFWKRNCVNCHLEIMTNYAPGRPEKVYCESCYQKEVL